MRPRFLLPSIFFLSTLLSFTTPPQVGSLQDVLNYTNSFRKSNGLPPLIMRDDLNAIAQKHSENMAKGKVRFGHDGFAKRQSEALKTLANAQSFAENVAYGATTGKDVVNEWKSSAGHRQNMLGAYHYVGIGIAADKHGRLYYTQFFVE